MPEAPPRPRLKLPPRPGQYVTDGTRLARVTALPAKDGTYVLEDARTNKHGHALTFEVPTHELVLWHPVEPQRDDEE